MSMPAAGSAGCRRCADSASSSAIVLTERSQGLAGLSDRAWVLLAMSNLAASLCARLYAPRPCMMLHPMHNGGQAVDCNVSWGRYFILAYENGSRAFLVDEPPLLDLRAAVVNRSVAGRMRDQFQMAASISRRGGSFRWTISQSFYGWFAALGSRAWADAGMGMLVTEHSVAKGMAHDGTARDGSLV